MNSETETIYKVKNWGLQKREIPQSSIRYTAPELFNCYNLVADVISHPKFNEGEQIITSVIDTIEDRIITTTSGSKYQLVGEPLLAFKESYIKKYGSYDNNKPLFPSYNSQ